jgi:hypothetical protein
VLCASFAYFLVNSFNPLAGPGMSALAPDTARKRKPAKTKNRDVATGRLTPRSETRYLSSTQPSGARAMSAGLTLAELDERIAMIRENLEELTEQAAADSSAGDDDLSAARIAEQEQELARLTELRDALLRS